MAEKIDGLYSLSTLQRHGISWEWCKRIAGFHNVGINEIKHGHVSEYILDKLKRGTSNENLRNR